MTLLSFFLLNIQYLIQKFETVTVGFLRRIFASKYTKSKIMINLKILQIILPGFHDFLKQHIIKL